MTYSEMSLLYSPLARPGFLTASILTFAHTVGEFGVVLMIGGNLPGVTRVASVQIYDHVEAMEYAQAHRLSAVMLVQSKISRSDKVIEVPYGVAIAVAGLWALHQHYLNQFQSIAVS